MTPSALHLVAQPTSLNIDQSHLTRRNGVTCAGLHLLIDLWDGRYLDDIARIERALRDAVDAVGATLLRLDLHHFTENNGVSGVAVLAESHMSIHTWPELGYAALDVFVCGNCDPYLAVPVLKQAFQTEAIEVTEHARGRMG